MNATTTAPTNGGNNYQARLEGLRQGIRDAFEHIQDLKAKNKANNDEMASIRADLKRQGIPVEAFNAAMKMKKLADSDDREAFEHGFQFALKAMDIELDPEFEFAFPADEAGATNEGAKSNGGADPKVGGGVVERGKKAFRDGAGRENVPEELTDFLRVKWLEGWDYEEKYQSDAKR